MVLASFMRELSAHAAATFVCFALQCKGCMWHALDDQSQTPLVAAVHAGCLDVVALLGADRSHMHYKVQWAAQQGHLQVSFAVSGGAGRLQDSDHAAQL
jgi:hypothetical protein